MRTMRFALMICLLLAFAPAGAAQVSQEPPMEQKELQATAQAGPAIRPGMPASADVFVGGLFAIRIPASAGGLSPIQRAQAIAERLNRAFARGMSWRDLRVTQIGGLWTVTVDSVMIATADVNSARAYGMQTSALASRWGRQMVIAMGGQPNLIARQLQPIPARVAGAREELGPVNWAISPAKVVPLLDAANANVIGSAIAAGPQARLDMANAAAMYEYMLDRAVVRTFVPITSASVAAPLRVHGIGLIGLSPAAVPTTGFLTGDEALQMTTQMAGQWNNLISSKLAGLNLWISATTKVVPLYSMNEERVVGAAQIVGTSRGVARARMVVMSRRDDMIHLTPTSAELPTAEPPAITDAVVSSLIYIP